MHDLAPWLVNRVQMTTDGHKEYLEANGERIWQPDRLRHIGQALREPERQRSACGSALQPRSVHGRAQDGHFGETGSEAHSTSITERQNLTMRMSMRRFTRLPNGFSKKLENHEHAVALYFM